MPPALAEWQRWWRSTVALTLVAQGHDVPGTEIVRGWARRSSQPDDTSPHRHEGGRALRDAYEAVRPGGLHRLAEPVLRAVVDRVEMDAHRWVDQRRREATALQASGDLYAARRGSVPWPVTREVARGAVLCSFDAALHPITARVMLRHAFTARL